VRGTRILQPAPEPPVLADSGQERLVFRGAGLVGFQRDLDQLARVGVDRRARIRLGQHAAQRLGARVWQVEAQPIAQVVAELLAQGGAIHQPVGQFAEPCSVMLFLGTGGDQFAVDGEAPVVDPLVETPERPVVVPRRQAAVDLAHRHDVALRVIDEARPVFGAGLARVSVTACNHRGECLHLS